MLRMLIGDPQDNVLEGDRTLPKFYILNVYYSY